jgi:GNAT superfamily N-acetyltransferase
MSEIRYLTLTGSDIVPFAGDLARLRMDVFRDFPYLYDGDLEYEERYLRSYSDSPESIFVVAMDGDLAIGMSTGIPLDHETEEFRQPFIEYGYDVSRIFYFGESVLLKPYRRKGLGRPFYAEREAYARRLGRFDLLAFCVVERPPYHPARPDDFVPLDAYWRSMGFDVHPELRTHFSWREIGEEEESPKPMVFWLKDLRA